MRYTSADGVKARLADLSDEELDDTYQEGLDEYANGGPADGNTARSALMMSLVKAEIADRQEYWAEVAAERQMEARNEARLEAMEYREP